MFLSISCDKIGTITSTITTTWLLFVAFQQSGDSNVLSFGILILTTQIYTRIDLLIV